MGRVLAVFETDAGSSDEAGLEEVVVRVAAGRGRRATAEVHVGDARRALGARFLESENMM